MNEPCRHRVRDCQQIAPCFQRCVCGQLFAFISTGQVGRYKKVEDLTEDDKNHFDSAMEYDFLRFAGKSEWVSEKKGMQV